MLAWLSILAYKNKGSDKLVTVEDIAMQHWKKFGRNFFRCTLPQLAVQYTVQLDVSASGEICRRTALALACRMPSY